MTTDYDRLLEQSAKERMISCMREVFIMRPEAMIAMDSYKKLLALPRLTDNPGMSITARSGYTDLRRGCATFREKTAR